MDIDLFREFLEEEGGAGGAPGRWVTLTRPRGARATLTHTRRATRAAVTQNRQPPRLRPDSRPDIGREQWWERRWRRRGRGGWRSWGRGWSYISEGISLLDWQYTTVQLPVQNILFRACEGSLEIKLGRRGKPKTNYNVIVVIHSMQYPHCTKVFA